MASAFQESLMETDRQASREGKVWHTLRGVAREFDRLGIPYAIVGGLAVQYYGFQRTTQDVDLLLGSGDDLQRSHAALVGHGFIRKDETSRHLRDEVTRVRVEFLIAGEFPGDGKPKSVRFPKPDAVRESSSDGLWFVDLRTLIELKLASAKSAPQRIRDRADVLELIHLRSLPAGFAEQLDPYVREEFRELAALPPPSEPD